MLDEQFVSRCASEVAAYAADDRFASRSADLRFLAQDISDPNGDAFAGTDLFAAFPAEALVQFEHKNLVERIVGVVAGISVFLPVGWTWWGFHSASAAYRDLIIEDGEPEGVTFLSLWATGFDGRLAGLHHLVPMAMVSLMLILFAIVSLVAHRIVAAVNVSAEERTIQSTRIELASTLMRAQLILNSRRADHPARIEGIVKSSLKKLKAAHDASTAIVEDLQRTGQEVQTSLEGLVATAEVSRKEASALLADARSVTQATETTAVHVGQSMTQSVEAFGLALQTGLAQTQDAFEGSVASLDSTMQSGVTKAQEAFASAASQLTSEFRQELGGFKESVASLDSTMQSGTAKAQQTFDSAASQLTTELREELSVFEKSLGQRVGTFTVETVAEVGRAGASLRQVIEQIESSAEANSTAARELTVRIGEMTDDSASTRAELVGSLEQVRDTLLGIESALDRHESVMQGQTSELSGARDSAERLLRRLTLVESGIVGGSGAGSI